MRTTATILLTVLLLAFGAGLAAAAPGVVDLAADMSGEANGALFFSGALPTATGTGVFNPFLRISGNTATPQGYNTDYRYQGNKLEFEADAAWTVALPLNLAPVVKHDGAFYREFILDVNQKASDGGVMISLDQLKLFGSDSNLVHDYDVAAGNFKPSGGGPLDELYDLGDYYVKIDASKAGSLGSGTSDVIMLIPESVFAAYPNCEYGNAACGAYIYLWSRFGDHYANNDGFEEWATQVYPTLEVTKTANTSYTQPYDWNIVKSVMPAAWKLFTGESGESQYTVAVTKSAGTPTNFVVSGNIYIKNTTTAAQVDTVLASVADVVTMGGMDYPVPVACPDHVVFPYKMAKGETLTCTYGVTLPAATPTSTGINTATATLVNEIAFSGTAPFDFAGAIVTKDNDAASVTDTNGMAWGPVTASTTWNYTKWFACDADEGKHDNTATVTFGSTSKSDDASVTVNCYQLAVEKDATTYWERKWEWSIDKQGDQDNLKLDVGMTFPVNYEVVVDAVNTDFAFKVSGLITVTNPAPIAAVINGVTDIVSPDLPATVTCGVTFPYTLAAGGVLNCTYVRELDNAESRTNIATATQQLHKYPYGMAAEMAGTQDYSGTAPVEFAAVPDEEWDECIDVTDSKYGFLGKVCAGVDTLPKKFTYTLTVGPYTLDQCGGEYPFENCASFVTNDWQMTDKSCWTVKIYVPCPGCTLTQGYWKTHSLFGKATINQEIYDRTWGVVGEGTAFFHSGLSYIQVMWTPPAKGNAYYILAHQWIAAYLNVLNDASLPTEVADAWNSAQAEFGKDTVTPAYLLTPEAAELRAMFIMWAGILGNYNEGMAGVPHCDY